MDRIIYAYGFEKNLDYTIFRPFNFIGPKLDNIHNDVGSRILTQFLHNAIHHQPLKLVDGGKNRRCFTYIEDGVDCLLRIINNENGCATGGIFNIGNPNENYSIEELAQLLKETLAEFDPPLAASVQTEVVDADTYYGAGYQDVKRRIPSIQEAQTKLGWSPKVTLKEALRKTLNFHFKGIDPDAGLLKQ
jgi:nucleoside-diphosphate-sugar epimerase